MRKCTRCGGRLRRVHRTLFERLGYMAIYECQRCHEEQVVLRRWRYHFGPGPRCPKCGSHRATKLKEPDHIDPMCTGLLNFLERAVSGKLYHCRFCRVQFYDRREIAPAEVEAPAATEPANGGGFAVPEPQSTERTA